MGTSSFPYRVAFPGGMHNPENHTTLKVGDIVTREGGEVAEVVAVDGMFTRLLTKRPGQEHMWVIAAIGGWKKVEGR